MEKMPVETPEDTLKEMEVVIDDRSRKIEELKKQIADLEMNSGITELKAQIIIHEARRDLAVTGKANIEKLLGKKS